MKLSDLKKLCDDATPGPWKASDEILGAVTYMDPKYNLETNIFGLDIDDYAITRHKPDAEFIAVARTMLPKLIAVAEAAKRCDENAKYIDLESRFYEIDIQVFLRLNEALEALESE